MDELPEEVVGAFGKKTQYMKDMDELERVEASEFKRMP